MPAANADPSINFDTYECKSNEVIIYCPVYNKSTGLYGGLTKKLGYITLHYTNFSLMAIKKRKVLCFILR